MFQSEFYCPLCRSASIESISCEPSSCWKLPLTFNFVSSGNQNFFFHFSIFEQSLTSSGKTKGNIIAGFDSAVFVNCRSSGGRFLKGVIMCESDIAKYMHSVIFATGVFPDTLTLLIELYLHMSQSKCHQSNELIAQDDFIYVYCLCTNTTAGCRPI